MEMFIISVVIILLLFIFVYIFSKEDFGNKEERAKKIIENTNEVIKKPSYSDFKSAMGGDTDVVEYDGAKKAYKNGDFNVEKLKNYL